MKLHIREERRSISPTFEKPPLGNSKGKEQVFLRCPKIRKYFFFNVYVISQNISHLVTFSHESEVSRFIILADSNFSQLSKIVVHRIIIFLQSEDEKMTQNYYLTGIARCACREIEHIVFLRCGVLCYAERKLGKASSTWYQECNSTFLSQKWIWRNLRWEIDFSAKVGRNCAKEWCQKSEQCEIMQKIMKKLKRPNSLFL